MDHRELIIAATSFHAGGMKLQDFMRLQDEDPYCQEIRQAETSRHASALWFGEWSSSVNAPAA